MQIVPARGDHIAARRLNTKDVIASGAKQSRKSWIASSLALLAMTPIST
jgi:hypothetical protein